MPKITKQNVGGVSYAMVGCTLTGSSQSGAAEYTKNVTLSDGDEILDGMFVACAFTNTNTAGSAPYTQTIYSSDQETYYEDAELTVPFTLAPAGCYTIEYTGEGNAYTYQSFPVIRIGSVSGILCSYDGTPIGGSVWSAGEIVLMLYAAGKFLIQRGVAHIRIGAPANPVDGDIWVESV